VGKLKQRLIDERPLPERNPARDRAEAELERRIDILGRTLAEMERRGFYDDIRRKDGPF
jgi:hypothetical protein